MSLTSEARTYYVEKIIGFLPVATQREIQDGLIAGLKKDGELVPESVAVELLSEAYYAETVRRLRADSSEKSVRDTKRWLMLQSLLPDEAKALMEKAVAEMRSAPIASQITGPVIAQVVAEQARPVGVVPERPTSVARDDFKTIAKRSAARGENRVLPILVGAKSPLVKWAASDENISAGVDTRIDIFTNQEWAEVSDAWIDDIAEKFPQANGAVIAKPNEYLFLDEDASNRFRHGYEQFSGEPFPDSYATSARPDHLQSHWKQTDRTRQMGNIPQGSTIDCILSVRQENLYVLAEGSQHKNGVDIYRAVNDSPIIPMPDKMVDYILSIRTDRNEKTGDFTKKPDGWLDAPFIHHNINNQLVAFAGHYISAKNIKDPDELYTLLTAKIEKNGCFYEDGVTPFPCNMKEVRGIAEEKVKTWKTGEEKRKETILAMTPATAQPVSPDPTKTDANFGEAIRRAMRTNGPREKRAFDYEGLIPSDVYCLWLGAMKAEKSLFGLRMAMHYACGKDWMNCRNLIGPVQVLYFDSENDGDEVNDRWEELLMEFASSEQTLIEQNLHIVKGKKLAREEKISIEYDNAALWLKLVEIYPNVKVVYLDCWYQLQNIKSADAGAQKSALEMFESYFPNRTLFLLHHTGREDSESLQKKKPMGLRELGPERWSNRVSQSIVVLKKADLIMCQEKRYDIDEEGSRMGEYIDFQVYSRSGTGTPLLTFEPVYGDEHMEYKYRRRMLTNLTTSAASLIVKVRDKGPWLSKRELVNEVGGGGRQYLVLAELQFKGFLMHDDRGYWFKEDIGSIISDASKNPVALKQAAEFLKRILTQGPMPETLVKQLAKSEGVLLGPPIRYAGCRSYLNKEDGQHYWLMNVRDEDEMTAREIKRLIDANPTATKVRLTELAKCSKRAVEKAIKALGLVKAPGRRGTWGPQGVENAEIGAMAAALGD